MFIIKSPVSALGVGNGKQSYCNVDNFGRADQDTGPRNAVAVVLITDTAYGIPLRGIWVGVAGNIKVDMESSGSAITFANVPVGYLSGHFSKIYSTANGTTAASLTAVW